MCFKVEEVFEITLFYGIRRLAQFVDEKSNLVFKVEISCAMGDSLSGVDSYS